ncbi:hypothetical protein MSTO_60620 [Mycobacterium stomatepiae]|uniref:Uncharacterized protein n=1 Tax=Mycobacterium stomatepiae TaxID=470076 RepID=A0A7I7QIE7_9MYCO|nr:hypothetical protein MSTO_60620 [Mycobacterium stomatepiae]
MVRLLRITTDSPAVEATSTRCQAVLEAFRGRAAAARRMIDSARRTVVELGLRHARLEVEQFAGIVELVVGDPAAAEPYLRKAYNGFRRMGLDADTAETGALLGRACLALDRDAEADELCSESERLAGHALKASMGWRTLRAHLLARRGDHEEARRVAEAAVSLAERTDALVDHGDACLTLATVLGAAGNTVAARTAAEQAVGLYERKGATALVEMARGLLDERTLPAPSARPEPSHVGFDNACVQAVARGDAAFHRGAFDEFEGCFADDILIESRRKILGFGKTDLRSGRWPYDARRSLEMDGAVQLHRTVVAVRGERLALYQTELANADVSPGAPRGEVLQLVGIDEDGRFALDVWFDVDDIDGATAELDAAHARFEAERPKARHLENAAARIFRHVWSHMATRDWDAIAQAVANDYIGIDRRRVLSAETQHSRDVVIRDLKAAAEVGFAISMVSAMAIRGERLVLARTRACGNDPETAQNDALNVVEIDADDRIAIVVTYDLEDFDAAIAELDHRYLAGEAAPHAHTWSAIADAFATLNRHEIPPMAPDWVTVDHRPVVAIGPHELETYLHSAWDAMPGITAYVEVVHQLSDIGAVVSHAAHGTSQEGFDAEWRMIELLTVKDEMLSRGEIFAETDIEAALARFEQLSLSTHRLENAATLVFDRFWSHYAARDWAALAETLAENVSGMDRRRVVNAGMRRGRDAVIDDLRVAADLFTISMVDVVALRGERLALGRVRAAGGDPETVQNDAFNVIEIDADERITLVDIFDLDDVDAAFNDLDARYHTGEAAPCAHTWVRTTENYAALSRHELPPMTADAVTIDHRRAAAFAPGEFLQYLRTAIDQSQRTNIHPTVVHRLNERGTVITHTAHVISRDGFEAEFQDVIVCTLEGDMVNHFELFDEADLDSAIARFDQLSLPAHRLENAATRMAEQFLAHYRVHDWDSMAELLSEDMCSDDRRRVVNSGIRSGRHVEIANWRGTADILSTNVGWTVVATRGEHQALLRFVFEGQGQATAAFQVSGLTMIEVDSDEQIVALVTFDLDDLDAAFAELDSRYVAGEASAHARTWSVITEVFAALNRHERLPIAPDFVNIDHRQTVSFAPGELIAYVGTGVEIDQATTHIEAVHRLNERGAVVTYVARGTSHDGFDAEWRAITLSMVEGDKVSRCEIFDEAALDAALARFEELIEPAGRLENTATQAAARFVAHFAAGDWAGMAETFADNFASDDRRRVIGAGVRRGRDAEMADLRSIAHVGITNVTSTPIATRGDRLVLTRGCLSLHDQGPKSFFTESLTVVEVNADDQFVALVSFDLDDIDAAFTELDARYLAGEAAAHAGTWSVVAEGYAALNRRELPPVTTDLVSADHRRVAPFAPGDLVAYIHALLDQVPGVNFRVEAVHRLSDLGAVVTHALHGTSQEGFDAEWRGIHVATVEGDLVNRSETFDEADLDAAIARFEQLSQPTRVLENGARRVSKDFLNRFETGDWDGLSRMLAEGYSNDDRRRMVGVGVRHGRNAEIINMQAIADVWLRHLKSTALATRGERLVLLMIGAVAKDQGNEEFFLDVLAIVEIDADERIAAVITFDADNIDAAFAELDTRYLAGEAAAQSDTWSAIVEAYAAINRGQLPLTTTDFEDIDRRRGATMAPGELLDFLRSALDQTSGLTVRIAAVHRLSSQGAIITHAAVGTSPEGFEAEWREVSLLRTEGDMLSRCEVFDEADVDAALARFDGLRSQLRRPKSATSQVVKDFEVHYAARDWSAMAEILAVDIAVDDRRHGVNAGIRHGRDAAIDDLQASVAAGFKSSTSTVVATRGERLALTRVRMSEGGHRPEAFQVDVFHVLQVDTEGQAVAVVIFDFDDIDAAFAELDARYLDGARASHAHTWSIIMHGYAALNRGEMPESTDDLVDFDHRRGATLEPGRLMDYLRAALDDSVGNSLCILAVHRSTSRGAVVTHVAKGTSRDGLDAEWRITSVYTIDGDLINHCEMFDEADLEMALARFEELAR